MSTVGFEPTISTGERPQTYALDRAATGTGTLKVWRLQRGVLIRTVKYADGFVLLAKGQAVLQGEIDRLNEIGR